MTKPDFCEVAILSAGANKFTFRYTYFEGYLLLLSRAEKTNASIMHIETPIFQQRNLFSQGLGKGRRVCIKIFPLLLEQSEDCVEFVLYHEIGHIRNKDIKIYDYSTLRKESISNGLVMLPELLADMYAAKKVGKRRGLIALNELLDKKKVSLAHLLKFGKKYKQQVNEDSNLLLGYNQKVHNHELSIVELNLRIEALTSLNIKE